MGIIKGIKNRIYLIKRKYWYPILLKNKQKIFCIGRNKTGTTSLKRAFMDLGVIVGNQRVAERLQPSYLLGDFNPIIKYCQQAQVFQDYPFSVPETYKHLDLAYPGSKFILTVRDSPEQWYNSLLKFHSVIFGNGEIPTSQDLKNANYIWKGWVWNNHSYIFNISEHDPYNKEKLIQQYIDYNSNVIEYFKDRPNDLIVINLRETDGYQRLMNFLGIDSKFIEFPWENKTTEVAKKYKSKSMEV